MGIHNRQTTFHTTGGSSATGGDFIGITCTVSFSAGSVPGSVSTPVCSVMINDDLIYEFDETFSLAASIINNNGLMAQFSPNGDSASATIIDNEGRCWILQLSSCSRSIICERSD